jgi:RNA polymerase sigma factor (TIGR02999 family)
MADAPPGDLTRLLQRWGGGDPAALDRLLPEVYPELHVMATRYLSHERPGTIQATALVHDLYLRLLKQEKSNFENRRAFFAFSASVMRNILVDNVRARQSQKRGGDEVRVPLNDDLPFVDARGADVIDLHDALGELAAVDPRKAELVELCAFLGCSQAEAAELLGISVRTAKRDFRMARAWLSHRLGPRSSSA